jgi:hypothetical protein
MSRSFFYREENNMLKRILREFESAPGGISINELSRRMEVERSALEGMIDYLVRQGKLEDDNASAATCADSGCGGSCPGPEHCPFAAELPRTFSVVSDDS